MKKRISFIVDPNAPIGQHKCVTFHSAMSRMRECMEDIGCPVPNQPYKVTYTVAHKTGRLKLIDGAMSPTVFVRPVEDKPDGARWDVPIICYIPREWMGTRFNRKVRLLTRKEVADAGLQTTEMQGVRAEAESA